MKFSRSFVLSLMTVFVAFSCSKHLQDVDVQSKNIIRISMPDAFATKVGMGQQSGNSISQVWNSGDRIAVVQGRGTDAMKMTVYALVGAGGTSVGDFEYVSGNADIRGEVDVVYPVEAAYGYSIPHSQLYVEGNYDSKSVVMSWHSENGIGENIVLENETALLCLRYTGDAAEKISRIRVKIEVEEGHYDTYVLAADPAVALSSESSEFYISVPSVSQSSDVTFETVLTDGSMMSITSKDRVFESGVVYRFPVVDFEKNADCSDDQEGYDVYLCIGQSNMSGRGGILAEDYGVKDGVFLLNTEGEPVPAQIPFNIYSTVRKKVSMQKFGLTNVFSEQIHEFTGRKILLVVNARGETSITAWLKDAMPLTFSESYNDDQSLWGQPVPGLYDEAVRRTRQAMNYGTLKGILWHHGGADSYESAAALYVERLSSVVSGLREDLGVGNEVPFILGLVSPIFPRASIINPQLIRASEEIPNAYYASSEGCETQSDNTHFTRSGYITIGTRYSEIILDKVYGIKAD